MTLGPGRDRIQEALEEGVRRGAFPGVAAVVAGPDGIFFQGAAGTLAGGTDSEPATPDTIYDLASLTKPLVTAACCLFLQARGSISPATRVVDVLPEFGDGGSEAGERWKVTVDDLLRHRSGLPAWRPYFHFLEREQRGLVRVLVCTREGRLRIVQLATREPLERAVGSPSIYSDIGYIVLGAVLERVAGEPLERLAGRELIVPLGLADTGVADLTAAVGEGWRPDPARTAPCGICFWRRAIVRGVVQDENAYAMAGVAGHAGLFSTARELCVLALAFLAAYRGSSALFDPELLRASWSGLPAGETWLAGWDTPSPSGSSAGTRISRRAVGHLGFTGASLWIDLDREIVVVVTSNRVHPDRHRRGIRAWRPMFHDVVFDSVG